MAVCSRSRREDGSVTAEAAVVIPTLVAVVLSLCWLVALGIAQIQVVDAARDAARRAARGDDPATLQQHVQRTAPGAELSVSGSDDQVRAHVRATVGAPGWLVVPLPTVTLEATSTVIREEIDHAAP